MDGKSVVLLGVTGGIAAYKSCDIVRGLQKAGVCVKVVMTEHATEFVSPLTFRALSQNDVTVGLFDDPFDPIRHISLAQSCDVMLIAPCTANVMAKIANGIADDLLTSTSLACTAPLIIAPAMNVHMYENPRTQRNIKRLKEDGAYFIEPEDGLLACGDVGKGKLADVADIVSFTLRVLSNVCLHDRDLEGMNVVVTAGPTREAIDPVRFLSNPSSGKMGYEIAQAAKRRGADVVLVSGPVSLSEPPGVEVIHVESAQEMLEAVKSPFDSSDIAIFCAAVCDTRPKKTYDRKLKKGIDDKAMENIEMEKTPDVLATYAEIARPDQFVVGFAAETDDVIENAKKKLSSKKVSMIVANDVSCGKAFGSDTDKAYFVTPDEVVELPELSKSDLADKILDQVLKS